MAVCNICGAEFKLIAIQHYIARDNDLKGMMSSFGSSDEPNMYDAFDCPHCGCQYIAQPRKRKVFPVNKEDDDES